MTIKLNHILLSIGILIFTWIMLTPYIYHGHWNCILVDLEECSGDNALLSILSVAHIFILLAATVLSLVGVWVIWDKDLSFKIPLPKISSSPTPTDLELDEFKAWKRKYYDTNTLEKDQLLKR